MSEVNKKPSANQKNCGSIFMFVLSIFWTLSITIVAQLMTWLMEQTIFEAAFLFPDLRWLINLAYAALITLPLVMLVFLYPDALLKRIFRFWASLGSLGFLLTLGRFADLTDSVLIGINQILGLILFGFLFWLLTKGKPQPFQLSLKNHTSTMCLVFVFIPFIAIPWVLWGALGSVMDVLINTIISIGSAVLIINLYRYIFLLEVETREKFQEGKIFRGVILFTGLIIFATVLGQSGQQLLMILVLPFSAWIIIQLIDQSSLNLLPPIAFLSSSLFFVLNWVDPDELALITSSGAGELIYWANRMVFTTVVLLLILTALFGYFNKRIMIEKLGFLKVITPVLWIGLFVLYLVTGQPGLYGESMFVILKDQADVRLFSEIPDYEDRRLAAYETLTSHANDMQADLRESLDRFNIPYTPYYLVNAIEVKAGPFVRLYLNSRPEVDRILDNPYLRPLTQEIPVKEGDLPKPTDVVWSVKMIGADRVWSEMGVTGEGIIIGQGDSGVDGSHPALKDKYVGRTGLSNTWFDPWNHSTFPQDFGGHGTHTLGSILGDNIGVAPGAEWIGCVNLARNLGNPVYYLDCMQFMLAPFPADGDPFIDGHPLTGADVLNNSWGCPEVEGCDATVFLNAVTALRAAGIFVVSSAGNSGYYGCESVTDPIAIYDEVLSVGSINEDGFLSNYSSLGPVIVDGSGRIKPDLVAPGEDVYSAMPNGTYARLSGTSMAGPHVVGVVALMWSANPSLRGNVDLTEKILFETVTPFEGIYPTCIGPVEIPNNAVGYGVVNAQRAVEEAINIR
ncbi:MAG: peptidase S8 [Anaerolineaceae bacterium]|nr:peptidase S8 [Anaerolineaceae bacterium]